MGTAKCASIRWKAEGVAEAVAPPAERVDRAAQVEAAVEALDPYPIPAPKDCTKELTHETCMQCCDWNVDKVWGERCRRIPKKNKEERKLCWIEAENRRSECQMPCPRPDPIVTIRRDPRPGLPATEVTSAHTRSPPRSTKMPRSTTALAP